LPKKEEMQRFIKEQMREGQGWTMHWASWSRVGRMCVEPPWERFETFKSRMGGDIPANSEWISLPGQVVAWGAQSGTIERWGRVEC